jgi:hypothetical protein
MYTNWGESIGTAEVTVNAPTVFTNDEYVSLSWNQPPGILRTEIYRRTGGTVHLLNNPYPQSSYKDKGATRGTVPDFPVADRTRMRAYIETTAVNFTSPTTLRWILAQLNVAIPRDYDKSKTTGKQWYVFGIADPIDVESQSEPESESETEEVIRALLIDKFSLDDKLGTFTRSPWDFDAKRGVSSNPTGGDQGDVPTGGNPIEPGGTGTCPTFDMPIRVECGNDAFEVAAIGLVDHEDVYKIVNKQGVAVSYRAEVSASPVTIYRLRVGLMVLTASEDEPVFINDKDEYKLLRDITSGDTILTQNGVLHADSCLRQIKRQHVVKITLTEGAEKGFWAGGIGIHNVKPIDTQF